MSLRFLPRVLSVLALVVPSRERARWREEWLGELAHVARERGRRAAMRMAAGALPDALAFSRAGAAPAKARTPNGRFHVRRFISTVSWLDLKLGVRMLIKYPGLALVAVVGMAVAIAIAAGSFAFFYSYMTPTLPLDEGERIVAIENWDTVSKNREERTLHDFVTWREELKSLEDVGAYRQITRNLSTGDGVLERVRIAEITASGFRLARVPPLLGRPLVDGDERKGALPVIVIGYDAWRRHFASHPAVVGKIVRLGNTPHAVVGVMPEGFAFPVNHAFWVPLHADASDYERRQGPAINVFARLAPGVSRDAAQAELTTIGLRAAATFPETNERLRPRLAPYTSLWFGDDMVAWHLHVMQVLVTMFLVVVSVNVASLVYARTASREGEIAIRSALGGSRRRIVTQLFVEALVLSAVAAAAGLLVADRALIYVNALMEHLGGAPFWMSGGLSLGAVLYVVGLAVLGAAIVGAVPALKATGRRLESRLRRGGGGTGLRLGSTWTTLIVFQVALAVAVMPQAFSMGWDAIGYRTFDAGFAADEFLTARLSMDRDVPPAAEAETYERRFAAHFGDRVAAVVRHLEAEPGVDDVTFVSRLPGNEPTAWIEVEGEKSQATSESADTTRVGLRSGHAVRPSRVGIDFFDAFDIRVLAGRRFSAGDLDTAAPQPFDPSTGSGSPRGKSKGDALRGRTISGKIGQAVGSRDTGNPLADARSTAIVVNRSFARHIFGGGNVLGRRVRYVGTSQRGGWYEIVGVVDDFPASGTELTSADARMYHAVTPAQIYPASIAVRAPGNTRNLSERLRKITTSIDPTLQLGNVLTLDQDHWEQRFVRLGALAFGIVTLSVLLLSAAGISALMSFTVAQRRREIGIRTALGGDPRRVLAGIFARALRQLAIGVVIGLGMAAWLFKPITESAVMSGRGAIVLAVVAVVMVVVGLIAAAGPARRALRIDPTETLRLEG